MSFNPNRRPFPRESVIRPFAGLSKIHPLRRDQYVASFKAANPLGYQHDLGAQDIFLDNFGMLFSDQFIDDHEFRRHCGLINGLLGLWAFADSNVIQKKPWWGKNLNIHVRRANAG